MSYKTELASNNTDLEAVLAAVNNLPEAISIDTTLSVAGKAADAKAVGDAISTIENSISGSGITILHGTIGNIWTEDEETGVKSQLVSLEGITANHTGISFDVVMTHERTSEGYAQFVDEQNQYLEFITNGDAETVDGGIMFYIYGEPNTIEIPFCMGVV